jgi:hypothetical protein
MRPTVLALAVVLTPLVATAQPRPETTLPPVVVEGSRVPDERTRTETEAREELRRVPGGTEVVGTLSPIRVLSTAIKAYAPDIAFTPDGSFLVAWHEEQAR